MLSQAARNKPAGVRLPMVVGAKRSAMTPILETTKRFKRSYNEDVREIIRDVYQMGYEHGSKNIHLLLAIELKKALNGDWERNDDPRVLAALRNIPDKSIGQQLYSAYIVKQYAEAFKKPFEDNNFKLVDGERQFTKEQGNTAMGEAVDKCIQLHTACVNADVVCMGESRHPTEAGPIDHDTAEMVKQLIEQVHSLKEEVRNLKSQPQGVYNEEEDADDGQYTGQRGMGAPGALPGQYQGQRGMGAPGALPGQYQGQRGMGATGASPASFKYTESSSRMPMYGSPVPLESYQVGYADEDTRPSLRGMRPAGVPSDFCKGAQFGSRPSPSDSRFQSESCHQGYTDDEARPYPQFMSAGGVPQTSDKNIRPIGRPSARMVGAESMADGEGESSSTRTKNPIKSTKGTKNNQPGGLPSRGSGLPPPPPPPATTDGLPPRGCEPVVDKVCAGINLKSKESSSAAGTGGGTAGPSVAGSSVNINQFGPREFTQTEIRDDSPDDESDTPEGEA